MFRFNATGKRYNDKVFYSLLLGLLCLGWMNLSGQKSGFGVEKNEQGLSVTENGRPVFYYQRKPRLSGEKYYFNNYLHPVFNLQGDTLTEEFPADHFHHRGIFWAWHQVCLNEKKIGDTWTMENISEQVDDVTSSINKNDIRIKTKVEWKSPLFSNEKAFLTEITTITVYKQQPGLRIIDFEIALKALTPGISIGGSEDEKGYGGFSTRIKLPWNVEFTGINGAVTPIEGQVQAGPWMDFSAFYDRTQSNQSGLTIICHPSTPNYPAPWILRQTGSMQNIVYPGSGRIKVPMDQPIILRYRILIHDGNGKNLDIPLQQVAYNKKYAEKKNPGK